MGEPTSCCTLPGSYCVALVPCLPRTVCSDRRRLAPASSCIHSHGTDIGRDHPASSSATSPTHLTGSTKPSSACPSRCAPDTCPPQPRVAPGATFADEGSRTGTLRVTMA